MIQASASFTAEDVSTNCRVRRSPYAAKPQFEEPMDMKATIRHWQQKSYYGLMHPTNNKHVKQGLKALRMVHDDDTAAAAAAAAAMEGPELVLTCLHRLQHNDDPASPPGIVERLSNSFEGRDRFESFGSHKQQRKLQQKRKANAMIHAAENSTVGEDSSSKPTTKPQQQQQQQQPPPVTIVPPIVIPLVDIVVVDVYHGNTKHMNLTTKNYGFFELRFETHNSYDVMLACLAATLPEDRIFGLNENVKSSSSNIHNNASHSSFDVDTLTAIRIAERMQRETFAEKLRRRMRRLCLNVEEMSTTIADSCGCGREQNLDSTTSKDDRECAQGFFPCTLEMDVDEEASALPDLEKRKNNSFQRINLLPSGLSVESADRSLAVWEETKKKSTHNNTQLPEVLETDADKSVTSDALINNSNHNNVGANDQEERVTTVPDSTRCNGPSGSNHFAESQPHMETTA